MRTRLTQAVLVGSILTMTLIARPAVATLIANDDASQATYSTDWTTSDNGGSGFAAWSTLGAVTGNGGTFISNNNAANNIGTGGSPGKAFGIFGNQGGVGHAIRSFSNAINVGERFSIDMDNSTVRTPDTGATGTVGFGLQNASGNNLFEFFFVGGNANYTVNASGVSGSTPGFTQGGLRLALTLTSATAFTLTIDRIENGAGIDHTVTGSLFSPAGGQSIAQMRLFNANAGQFSGQGDLYFNSFSVESIPEASAVAFFGMAIVVTSASVWLRRKLFAPRAS